MDKEYIDSPQYWVRQHIIGKAYNVDKYTLNRFIEAIEWQITENEQLQKRLDESLEVIKIIDLNFRKITKCPDNSCDGCHEDAKIAAEYSTKFLSSLGEKGE